MRYFQGSKIARKVDFIAATQSAQPQRNRPGVVRDPSRYSHRTIPVPREQQWGGIHQNGWIAADSREMLWPPCYRAYRSCAPRALFATGPGYAFVLAVWGDGWDIRTHNAHVNSLSLSFSLYFSLFSASARVSHEFSHFLHVRGFRSSHSPSILMSLRSSHERACFSSCTHQCACVRDGWCVGAVAEDS